MEHFFERHATFYHLSIYHICVLEGKNPYLKRNDETRNEKLLLKIGADHEDDYRNPKDLD